LWLLLLFQLLGVTGGDDLGDDVTIFFFLTVLGVTGNGVDLGDFNE